MSKALKKASRQKAAAAQKLNPSPLIQFLAEPFQIGKDGSLKIKEKSYQLKIAHAPKLSVKQKEIHFSLFEKNMRKMYEASSQGWNTKEKKRELFDSESRFLSLYVPKTGSSEPTTNADDPILALAGFVMFRFDTEECDPRDPCLKKGEEEVEIAYCYELQISSEHQSSGLGSTLMKTLELLALQTGMRKCMLTVFKSNTKAIEFYEKAGYSMDLISPSKQDEDDSDSSDSDDEETSKKEDKEMEDGDWEEDDDGEEDYEIYSKVIGSK